MRETYPFFREADERTRAVIGEAAVDADLRGDYQKPYAVLSQKRLYCRNETGNYIAEAGGVRDARLAEPDRRVWWGLWTAVGIAVGKILWSLFACAMNQYFKYFDAACWVTLAGAVCALLLIWRGRADWAPIPLILGQGVNIALFLILGRPNFGYNGLFVGTFTIFQYYEPTTPLLCAGFALAAWFRSRKAAGKQNFLIRCDGAQFLFPVEQYSKEELERFGACAAGPAGKEAAE